MTKTRGEKEAKGCHLGEKPSEIYSWVGGCVCKGTGERKLGPWMGNECTTEGKRAG